MRQWLFYWEVQSHVTFKDGNQIGMTAEMEDGGATIIPSNAITSAYGD